MMDYYSDFKTRLNELTPNRGDLKPLADAVGVTENAVSQWKAGRNTPTLDKFQKIADYYKVSFDWLAGRSDVRTVDPEEQAVSARYGLRGITLKELKRWARIVKDVKTIEAEQTRPTDANKTTIKADKKGKAPACTPTPAQLKYVCALETLQVLVLMKGGSDILALINEYIAHDFEEHPVSLSSAGMVLDNHLKKNPDRARAFYTEAIRDLLENVREGYQGYREKAEPLQVESEAL